MKLSKSPLIFIGVVLAVTACGNADLTDGPCDQANPPPECSETCAVDTDCPFGFYCGADGACTADCTPGEFSCPDGEICDNRGRCVTDPMSDGGTCPSVTVTLDPVTPTIMFLIDQSGSMTTAFSGGNDRWQSVRSALVDPTNGVVTTLQDKVYFGATIYTNDGAGMCPDLVTVGSALNNVTPITALLTNNGPANDTPTGESIMGVLAYMQANPPPAGSPPVMIVATDGEPDTCAVPNPQTGQPEAIAAAQATFAAGIPMYILSVGSDVGAPHLQDMANAGVGLPVGGATNAPYYVANSQSELVAKLSEIIAGTRTCELTLNGQVDLSRADEGVVILNGMNLVYGTDWTMSDPTTLVLLGDSCDFFLETPNVNLEATFPCGVVVN